MSVSRSCNRMPGLFLASPAPGERLCDELAPELTSLLTQLEMPANFVPVTNTVLAEMQRRGVSRDRILATLHKMGGEVPLASVRMLQVGHLRQGPPAFSSRRRALLNCQHFSAIVAAIVGMKMLQRICGGLVSWQVRCSVFLSYCSGHPGSALMCGS